MSTAFYFFRLGWPFLKEWILGGTSLKEGMKTQKRRVFLLFFVTALIVSLLFLVPKFIHLTQEHGKLEKSSEVAELRRLESKVVELQAQLAKATSGKPEVEVKEEKPPDPPEAPPPSPPKDPEKTPEQKPTINDRKDRFPQHRPRQEVAAEDRRKAYMDFFERYEE